MSAGLLTRTFAVRRSTDWLSVEQADWREREGGGRRERRERRREGACRRERADRGHCVAPASEYSEQKNVMMGLTMDLIQSNWRAWLGLGKEILNLLGHLPEPAFLQVTTL